MNWKSIINEILATGKTQVAVADRLGRSQAWVSAVSQGKYADIGWSDGQALLALHAELFGAHDSAEARPDGATESLETTTGHDVLAHEEIVAASAVGFVPAAPEPIHECASGDPRCHPERRRPEKRQRIERRKENNVNAVGGIDA